MRRLLLTLAAASTLALAGCTAPTPRPGPTTASPTAAAVRFPGGATVVAVDDATAPARAVAASRAFFAASPGVVLAPDRDGAAQREAAALAARLHVPMLLTPGSSPSPTGTGGATADPSARATASADVSTPAAGPTADPSAAATASAAGTAGTASAADATVQKAVAAEARRLGARWAVPVGGADRIAGVRSLRPSTAPAPAAPAPPSAVAIAAQPGSDTAALATARAAGATVVDLPDGSADLNASGNAVAALAKAKDARTVLIGGRFAGQRDLDWAVAAARTGWQYPGGGQVPFDGRRLFVALYGTPGDGVLGVLGQQDRPKTIARVRALAKRYGTLTDRRVEPMLEVIATVASGSPTDDGDYSSEIDPKTLGPYIEQANAAGIPVVLDLQPGRTDFLTQAKRYADLLRRPGVGLALDAEWRLGPKQKPLVQIGRVSAAEVNRTSAWLADLVKQHDLPPKPFVLHQFRLTMLQDRQDVVVDRPQLDTLIHVDGQGGQADKQATWRATRAGAPSVAWGWKNFLKMDHPVLTPEQTIAQVHPVPDLITYQ